MCNNNDIKLRLQMTFKYFQRKSPLWIENTENQKRYGNFLSLYILLVTIPSSVSGAQNDNGGSSSIYKQPQKDHNDSSSFNYTSLTEKVL